MTCQADLAADREQYLRDNALAEIERRDALIARHRRVITKLMRRGQSLRRLLQTQGEKWSIDFQIMMQALRDQSRAERERDALAFAIRWHRSQKADDRCAEDDDRLYAALGDGIKCDRRVGNKADMLANCQ